MIYLPEGFHALSVNDKVFKSNCIKLHKWIRSRLDLCGGWIQNIDDMYTPRTFGVYVFSQNDTRELCEIARRLGKIYTSVGKQIQESFLRGDLTWKDWKIDCFDVSKQKLFEQLLQNTTTWATTLRADFALEKGCPKIFEVNSDNVAGLEDLFMFLHYHQQCFPEGDSYRLVIDETLTRLRNCLQNWINQQYAQFRSSIDNPAFFPEDPKNAKIVVVYEDRYDSFFLARYFGALLNDVFGFSVCACRPEHLVRHDGKLFVETPITGALTEVHIVFRHWLFFEMFKLSKDGMGIPDEKFSAVIEASVNREALVLNPIKDRLLFTKAILAELYREVEDDGMFNLRLSDFDKEFIKKYIVPTEYASEINSHVFKPSSEFGGKDVIIGTEQVWVKQLRAETEQFQTFYRREPTNPNGGDTSKKNLFVVHGLLCYGIPGHGHELAGIYTRMCPDPVVNFGRGAQIIPGLLQYPPKLSMEL